MDVIRHHSPSRTSQYYHAEECCGETMGDCDPCYGMTKLHEGGGGERNGVYGGGWAASLYHIVSNPVEAFH